ncbi:hypothetical protein MNBD_ALPHA04-2214 [hydrothermal vent metagenome]|uniref:Lipocalin-like domain-containing protein n=1 Tax=hydrothermal vent metagenome TaxID=652676 RepID=A0A3B0R320_9ZZZZ
MPGSGQIILFVTGLLLGVGSQTLTPGTGVSETDAQYFEGRWAFEEETCDLPTNWTLIAGGNFVSEDLIGTWAFDGSKLLLRLTDLAIDEETGDAGGKFQMEGPVTVTTDNQFSLTIEPDIYVMKRCN